ncbi:MAG: PQQ-binding-like beta-propeller repeat protein [Candidatus Latescibacteria bacterium]|nr:PQQ-binding-like beta-propeller repeat protein [Candidatus Latescibacterota bacterium]
MPGHRLMPGIRSDEINNPNWSRTLHDKQLTGFSPLPLGMERGPQIWRSIEVPGQYNWVEGVATAAGAAFLVDDGRLALYEAATGARRWCAEASGRLVFWGNLYGDGDAVALLRQGNTLTVVDGESGGVRWRQSYEPAHVDLRVQVGAVLAGAAGLQAAVFEQYGEWGWLLDFAPDGSVREVWRRQVMSNDVWPVRADHGCDIALALQGDRSVIWNVRHHRCQYFDAQSGQPLGCLQYELDGAYRRNYGPWRLAKGADGQDYIAVAAEMVQTHVHAIRLHGDGTPELAWARYYGEVYVVPGVAVECLGVGDFDGDGGDEIAYNVRDPECGFGSFVRLRDVATGAVKYEWADRWCSRLVEGVGPEGRGVLLLHPALEGATPQQGPLEVVGLAPEPQVLATFAHGGPWGVTKVPGDQGGDFLLRLVDERGPGVVRLDGVSLEEKERVDDGSLLAAPPDALAQVEGHLHWTSAVGIGAWPQGTCVPLGVRGGSPSTLSAAALGDGPAQLFAHTPGHQLKGWALEGETAVETLDEAFFGERARHSPLVYDLDGDGRLELVVPGVSQRGELAVRALRPDGTVLWHTLLPRARSDDGGQAVAWNAGQFLAGDDGPRAGLAVTVYSLRRTLEGTFMLAGDSGEVLWFKGNYRDGEHIRAYRPVGIPGVFDWDGDGLEEIAWDMYSYMAFVRGNGEMAAVFGGENVRPAREAVPAILLYNGFTPIYRTPADQRPHWLVHHGHGRFGLVGPDPRQGIWHEEEGYDTPERIGFVDVDGDGVMEVGYALRNSAEFVCRDLWSGAVKWTVELPGPPSGPVISADVDGDGRGEFLVDRWCIGTDAAGQGEIRWTAPVSMGWAVIADFDGDGLGEIACPGAGRIVVLKGNGAVK